MKENNKGFSLVELLVSIVILGIIMIPILDNILASANMNRKSKQIGDATVLASNMMESLKAKKDFFETRKSLLGNDKDELNKLFIGCDLTQCSVSQVKKQGETYVAMDSSTLEQNNSDSCIFSVKDLSYQNQKYNGIISYDAGAYKKEPGSINNQEVIKIPEVSRKENAVILAAAMDVHAASILKNSYNQWFSTYCSGENTMTVETIAASMKRIYTITISRVASVGKYKVTAEIDYTVDPTVAEGWGNISKTAFTEYNSYKKTIFEESFEKLKEVYLFFTPDSISGKDNLKVVNTLPKEEAGIACYLIAQKQEAAYYEQLMKKYELILELIENDTEKNESGGNRYRTFFHTNIEDVKGKNIKDTLSIDDMVKKEENKNRLYEVTVTLYKADEKEPYSEKNKVASVTTAKGENK